MHEHLTKYSSSRENRITFTDVLFTLLNADSTEYLTEDKLFQDEYRFSISLYIHTLWLTFLKVMQENKKGCFPEHSTVMRSFDISKFIGGILATFREKLSSDPHWFGANAAGYL